MAEMQFSIIAVNASLKQKSVFIECALDIDEDTVSSSSIVLLNKTTNSIELCDYTIDGHIIQAKMKNDPQPGDSYSIIIQGTIESVVGDKLESALMRDFKFNSEVVSEITILEPATFARVSKVVLRWKETGKTLENSFELQIAKENAFYNIVVQSKVAGNEAFDAPELMPGQYYARVRAIKDDDYGRWSDICTFIFEQSVPCPSPDPDPTIDPDPDTDPPAEPIDPVDPPVDPEETEPVPDDDVNTPPIVVPEEDPDAPIIIVDDKVLDIDEYPTNGITPSGSFSFVFNENIAIDNIEMRVYRSDF